MHATLKTNAPSQCVRILVPEAFKIPDNFNRVSWEACFIPDSTKISQTKNGTSTCNS